MIFEPTQFSNRWCSKNRICFITFDSWIKNFFGWAACNHNFTLITMKKNFFENSHFFGYFAHSEVLGFLNNFSKIAWAKNFEVSLNGSVFDTEKHGHKIFPKSELFGFLRN